MERDLLRKLEASLRLPHFQATMAEALARAADPDRALHLGCKLIQAVAASDRERFERLWISRHAEVARIAWCLGGAAPFLIPFFVRDPAWLFDLAEDDLRVARSAEGYTSRLSKLLEGSSVDSRGDLLRRFKYYELARVTVRDLCDDLVPEERSSEIFAELSDLADALLASALASVQERMRQSCGPPRWRVPNGEVELGFCVFGLGKLGSRELNYSSDVDLIYVYEEPSSPVSNGPQDLTPQEYFARLARELGRLVSEPTGEGFLYRIDLDLRPEGAKGPLVVSSNQLIDYYELWAATWEKAAFMKARPVTGDLNLGARIIRAVDPMIYRSSMDYAGVAAIKEMKEKIEQTKGRSGETFDVKIGAGGIRDVELVAQALQMLHGGRIPQIRARSTQVGLRSLEEVGVLPARDADALLSAYRFLRRTENRLQMEAERQTHRLPKEREALRRLARAMGFLTDDGVAAFENALEQHRGNILAIFSALFPESRSDRVLALFSRAAPQLVARPELRQMIETLAGQFAREIDASPNPERAMINLERFIQGVGGRKFYYELLLDRPELVPRLTGLFAASEYLSTYFATHPRLIEPVFSDPNVFLLSRDQLRESFASIFRDLATEGRRDEVELGLDALRLFHNRELINIGLLDLAGKVPLPAAEAALTEAAEVCIEKGLALARAEMRRRAAKILEPARAAQFIVVGMGKLGSRELTYGSDLDVIFLYEVPDADEAASVDAQEYFVRVAQKLIWTLQARTKEGLCYLIDARLRPSGMQGMLVSSIDSFRRYHQSSAQVWERQALLRARAVAGSPLLAGSFEELRLRILSEPLPSDAAKEIHRIRLRMEVELAHETTRRHDFKTGRGGLTDVETAVQYLQLVHGVVHPELFVVDTTAAHIERLARLGLLDRGDAHTLTEGWGFLRRLSSRLRIVENRSISDLDEERGDLDALAHRLGYSSQGRESGARRALLDDYRRHTAAIRGVYLKILGVEDTPR